jgi:hypothetical protein
MPRLLSTNASAATIVVLLLVGSVFLSDCIRQQFIAVPAMESIANYFGRSSTIGSSNSAQ